MHEIGNVEVAEVALGEVGQLRVVLVEDALTAAALHGAVDVQQKTREA